MFRRIFLALVMPLLPAAFVQAQAVSIENPSGNSAMAPALTTLPDGAGAILSWIERNGGYHVLKLSRYENGRFGEVREIARGRDWFANWADTPAVHARADGTWIAHWLEKSADATYAYDIRVAHSSDAGKSWSEPKTPHGDRTSTEHGFVSYFPAGRNRTGIVWLDGRETGAAGGGDHDHHGGFMTLRTAMIDADGSLEPDRLLDDRVCDCCQTASGTTALGPVVAYRNRTEDEIRDIAVVRRTADGWTEPRLVHADGWKIGGCPVNGPSLLASGMRVIVAWFTMADNSPRVRFAISTDAGATFGPLVTRSPGTALGRVQLAWIDEGFALSWMDDDDDGARLQIARYSLDGKLLGDQTLGRLERGRVSGFPRMVDVDGRLLLAWTTTIPRNGTERGTRISTALIDQR